MRSLVKLNLFVSRYFIGSGAAVDSRHIFEATDHNLAVGHKGFGQSMVAGSQLGVAADIHSLRQQARIVAADSKLGCIAATAVFAKLLSLKSIVDCM